jgi:hypothetical protein
LFFEGGKSVAVFEFSGIDSFPNGAGWPRGVNPTRVGRFQVKSIVVALQTGFVDHGTTQVTAQRPRQLA